MSSGFNHEHTWHPTAEFYDEETIAADQTDTGMYPWIDESVSIQQLEAKEAAEKTSTIKFDEIDSEPLKKKPPSPIKKTQVLVKEQEPEPEPEAEEDEEFILEEKDEYEDEYEDKEITKDISVNNVRYNQYCIIVHGKIVDIVNSSSEVENVVEEILFDDHFDDTTSIEDIIVFKRLIVKAGVVVKE